MDFFHRRTLIEINVDGTAQCISRTGRFERSVTRSRSGLSQIKAAPVIRS
jgi:hypothetical protein